MAQTVDVELARTVGFTEEAGDEREIELEYCEITGVRESYAAVEPIWDSGGYMARAVTEYVFTVTLGGKPVIRCKRDFCEEVESALYSREDPEPEWTEEDLLADAPNWIEDDPLVQAVCNEELDDVVAARGGSMTLGEVAALASDAWDSVELLA